ncbi:flap endonuclease GEN [Topomyia yanbarensis]|uniref:flap endonuclease GEN n=1 Tax=Topomyia yanbarensis TaxID=2498891 RepID=UPI00273CACB4|nr:flap endonuclease GEN [Topomyia yanbarensis]
MGIKDLWNVLTPYCERKPLFELNNKAVAIDLSGWVCESLNVVDYFVHPRFYLRNLFFRTCYLLQTGIVPVFILEGTAPPLKYGVIIKRNQLQFRGARPKKAANCDKEVRKRTEEKKPCVPKEQKRNRFHNVLKQCEELLSALGLVCVQAPGEAEALCAYLNHDNLVYGVVSQDSDCFAYGAIRVFRNFCASQNGGSVDVYDLEKISQVIDLGQEKIVVMGILAGCDYCPAGVPGVGREAVSKLLGSHSSKDILTRIRSWRKTADTLTELEIKVDDKNICADCGHNGKTFNHRRYGCQDCKTKNGCDDSKWKQQRANIKAEMDVKRKALLQPEFPPEAIIDEFMVRSCELPKLDLEWRQPNLVKFIRSISDLLQWNEIYSFQKLLPLLTRWQILALAGNSTKKITIALKPDFIKKKRSPKGVASFEIVWKHEDSCFAGLIPEDQIQAFLDETGNTLESLWSTIEPQDSVEAAYPELVQAFRAPKTKPKRTKKVPDCEQRKKRTMKKPKDATQRRLEEFLSAISDGTIGAQLYNTDDFDKENSEPLNDVACLATSPSEVAQRDPLNSTKHNVADMSIDSVDLSTIALEASNGTDFMNLSEIVDRVCDPNYGRVASSLQATLGTADLLSMSIQIDEHAEDELADHNEKDVIQRRLLLKQDVIHVATSSADQSMLNCSIRLRKRKSFFFEPLNVPPPELQDYCNEIDMFECSLMLKDQIVVPLSDEFNQTIVYDIDF